MNVKLFFLHALLLLCLNNASANDLYVNEQLATTNWAVTRQNFPHLSHETLEKVYPYLLPDDHPIKAQLDCFFTQFRLTQDEQSLKQANFTNTLLQYYSQVVVTRHPLFEGYIFKIYTDNVDCPKYVDRLVSRAKGASAIANYISRTETENIFTVPRKWIYLIPPIASAYTAKDCLLIADEVDILPYDESAEKWQSESLPKSTLDAVAKILQDLGLFDSIGPHNIPFTQDNKIAFIDTDGCYWWPTPSRFPLLGEYLSAENKAYWLSLVSDDATIALPDDTDL